MSISFYLFYFILRNIVTQQHFYLYDDDVLQISHYVEPLAYNKLKAIFEGIPITGDPAGAKYDTCLPTESKLNVTFYISF